MRTYVYNLTLNQEGQVRHKQKSVSGCVGASVGAHVDTWKENIDFNCTISIIVNLDASVKIQIGSGPIQNINASIRADDWCEHSFSKLP